MEADERQDGRSLMIATSHLRLNYYECRFLDPGTEKLYKRDVVGRSRNKIRFAAAGTCLAFALLAGLQFVPNIKNRRMMGVCGFSGLSFAAAIVWALSHGSWLFRRNRAEVCLCLYAMCTAIWFAFCTSREIRGGPELWPRAALESFCLTFGLWPPLIVMVCIHVEVIGWNLLRWLIAFMAIVHATRSLYMTPVDSTWVWVVSNYLIWPVISVHVVNNIERNKREMFIAHQILKEHNSDLLARLDEAERALANEQPTDREQDVIESVFGADSVQKGLRHVAVNFADLTFHERVGSGAFAEVIRVTYHDTSCVVKRLLRAMINKHNVSYMLDEVRVLSKLRHPNIIQFLGVSWDSAANLCIVFELMRRGSVWDVLHDASLTLTWEDPKLRMATDIARGLLYLHSRSPPILHRDVKPDNVLVTAAFTCKLSDFGAACAYYGGEDTPSDGEGGGGRGGGA